MKNVFLLLFSILFFLTTHAFTAKPEKVMIQTSGVCDECKSRIELSIMKLDGVKSAYFNLSNAKVKVVFDPSTVNLSAIKNCISKAGYDADEIKADGAAYHALPGCCKKGNVCTDHKN